MLAFASHFPIYMITGYRGCPIPIDKRNEKKSYSYWLPAGAQSGKSIIISCTPETLHPSKSSTSKATPAKTPAKKTPKKITPALIAPKLIPKMNVGIAPKMQPLSTEEVTNFIDIDDNFDAENGGYTALLFL